MSKLPILRRPSLPRPTLKNPVRNQFPRHIISNQPASRPATVEQPTSGQLSPTQTALSQPVSKQTTPFPFLKLPKELHQMILCLAIDNKVLKLNIFKKSLGELFFSPVDRRF